jgi:hypothetical protein
MLEHFDTVMSFAVVMLLLSLLVTTLVQVVIALSGLRASVLQWGIENLLKQVSPSLTAHAPAIAEALLRHAMVRPAGRQKATSIRKEEMIRLLDDLADAKPSPLSPGAQAALVEVLGVAQKPEFQTAAVELKKALEGIASEKAAQLQTAVDNVLGSARKAVADIGVWFDTVMDRTTENFLLKTRLITVGVALVLALALHVDSLSIIRQLASQPELRAALVQSADSTLRTAEGTFALTAAKEAIASAAITDVKEKLTADPNVVKSIAEIPQNLRTREEGETWLIAKLRGSPSQQPVLDAYGTKFDERTKVWLSDLRESAKNLNASLRASDLMVIPSPVPPLKDYIEKPGHLLGTLMTVLLLSLGAPFWYNALRQLANLRPAVAQKIEPKSLTGN